ncbi:decaprenyl-phosphate phosphoribosyltransferase [Abditibacteriota bacterium]|nr:decaprenyl-phosphate phosphoribosyltransferase [Abditibacteriota bacterium]
MTFKDFLRAVRTRQWAKNALLFGGFIFAGRLRASAAHPYPLEDGLRVLMAFACFCALSGAAYLINDWQDLERDRAHPIKQHRPLASGRISLRVAFVMLAVLLTSALVLGLAVVMNGKGTWGFGISALFYFALTLAYSFRLKHEVIIDVLSVAAGFLVRVVAGCLAVPVDISPWILFCTFNLALFVALNKRRAELLEVGEGGTTRKVLQGYSVPMLDTFIAVAAALTIISYSLYTFNAPHIQALGPRFGQSPFPLLMLSVPFVVYGVFRFLLLAHSSPVGGEPEQMLRDRPMIINAVLWTLLVSLLTVLSSI